MAVDTDRLKEFANGLAWRKRLAPPDYSIVLRDRHQRIQNQLDALIRHLSQSAGQYESLEEKIQRNHPYLSTYVNQGQLDTHYGAQWNVIGQLARQERNTSLYAGIGYTFQEAGIAYKTKWLSGRIDAKLGDVQVEGECGLRLWKDEQWDPSLHLQAQAEASLLKADAQMRVGSSQVYVQGSAQGSVGSVYGEASCILNADEQVLEAGVGAAALKGEATISFHAFGAKISLTAQGSLGSAEANLSYKHKNKEWEFGSKLGFIAGLGFKVRVSY